MLFCKANDKIIPQAVNLASVVQVTLNEPDDTWLDAVRGYLQPTYYTIGEREIAILEGFRATLKSAPPMVEIGAVKPVFSTRNDERKKEYV